MGWELFKFTVAMSALFIVLGAPSNEDCEEHFLQKGLHDGTKDHGDPCHNDTDCQRPGYKDSLVCVPSSHIPGSLGHCDCPIGTIFQPLSINPWIDSYKCVNHTPSDYGERCVNECEKPFQCAEATDLDVAASSEIRLHQKYCLCRPPYKMQEKHCVMECQVGEYYSDSECKRYCAPDEREDDNGHCTKLSRLGGACKNKSDCFTAFADCIDAHCACMEGTKPNEKKDFCESQSHTCPFGEPVIDVHGNTLRCYELSRTETPYKTSINGSKQLLSKCPDGYFCTVKDEEMRKTFKVGHCCQKPKPYCPYGEPLTDGPCQESCPQHTHYCHRYDTPFMEVCCPRQCSGTQQFIAGRCRSASLPLGAPCDYNEQCGNGFPEGFCVNGQCACAPGFATKNTTAIRGELTYFCVRQCGPGERKNASGECEPIPKLGDPCDPHVDSDSCPTNARCSWTNKTCVCECDAKRLSDRVCGKVPECEGQRLFSFSDHVLDWNITDYTFCKLPGIETSVPSVDRCSKDHYCSKYINNEVGVCCPKPELKFITCRGGSVPTESCEPGVPGACPKGQFCWKYADDVVIIKGSTDGHACCPVVTKD